MMIDREPLVPMNAPLVGFEGTRVYPLGAVTLSVMVGDYLQQITKGVTFLVIDCLSAYNAILGQPTLNSWKAVTSTYHLMIKFPHRLWSREAAQKSGSYTRMLHSYDGDGRPPPGHEHRRASNSDRAR